MLPHHHNGAAAAMAQQPQYHQHPHFFGAPAQQQFAMHDGGNMHMLQQQQHQQQQQQQHHQPAMMPQYQHQQQQHHLQQAQQYQHPYQHAPFSMSSMSTTSGPVYSSVIAGPSQPLQQWSGLNVDPNVTATASVSGNNGVPDWQPFGAEDDADMTGDMSNMGDDGEEGDGEKGKTFFACTHCDKSYRGKHARSIWRRHLQDKHGIPLSIQPRRTRWDADANRPKNAEERRERMLESKRRWARKKRAADKIEAKKAEAAAAGASADVIAAIGAGSPCSGDEENSPALGRGSALPAVSPEEPPQPLPQPQSQPPVLSQSQPQPQPALVHPQALFDGNSMRPANGNINGTYSMVSIAPGAPPHFIDDPTMNAAAVNGFCPPRSSFPPSTSTLVGAFASPLRAMPARRGVASPAPALGVTTPSRPMAPSAAMSRSSSGNNPFSLDHHRISPIAQRTKVLNPLKVLTDNSPSRLAAAAATSAGANRPSTSSSSTSTDSPKGEGSGASSSMRRVLPPLVGTPMRPSMIRDGVVDSMFLYGSSDRAAGRNSVTRMAAKRAKRNASAGGLSDEENDERGVDDRDRISSPVVKGAAANGSSAARRRGAARRKVSSADEGDLLGGKGGAGVGAEDDDDDAGLVGSFTTADDSGIYMPDFTPFHKSIGRAAGLGGSAIGMTPGPLMDGSGAFDSLAFPRTVGRPTPSTRNRRRKDDGNSSGSEDAASAAGPLGRGGRRSGDQFSSPHHPNLASSLGLAPQSALRSSAGGSGQVGSAAKTRSSSGSGASLPLYANSTPFAASTTYGLSGMSLGFTPFGSKGGSSSGGGGLPGIPSPAGSLLWPDSVRVSSSKKRASGNSSAAGHHGSTSMMRSSSGDDLIGDTPSLSSGSKRARAAAAAAAGKAGPAKVKFSGSSSSDDELALGSGSGSGKAQQASQRSGQAESDDEEGEGQNLGPGGRYHAVDETPSRPPALRGLSRRKGKSIDEEDEEEEEEDGDRGALKPLRFNAAAV